RPAPRRRVPAPSAPAPGRRNQAGTTTALAANKPTSVFGEPISFTATVVAASPGAGVPTGMVAFKHASPDGTSSVTLGPAPLDAPGHAVFTKDNLVPADHTIFAVYLGDSNFSGSTSNSLVQKVTKADTEIRMVSLVNPSVYGQSGTFGLSFRVVPP